MGPLNASPDDLATLRNHTDNLTCTTLDGTAQCELSVADSCYLK